MTAAAATTPYGSPARCPSARSRSSSPAPDPLAAAASTATDRRQPTAARPAAEPLRIETVWTRRQPFSPVHAREPVSQRSWRVEKACYVNPAMGAPKPGNEQTGPDGQAPMTRPGRSRPTRRRSAGHLSWQRPGPRLASKTRRWPGGSVQAALPLRPGRSCMRSPANQTCQAGQKWAATNLSGSWAKASGQRTTVTGMQGLHLHEEQARQPVRISMKITRMSCRCGCCFGSAVARLPLS